MNPDFDLLCDAVREGGGLALAYFRNEGLQRWDKNPGDPVSEADLAIDSLLKDRLCRARPDYGWLSEETADDLSRLARRKVWVVDPIDGTRAFLRGSPEFSICAALIDNGVPIAGAVFNPATDQFFSATIGNGATCNNQPIMARRTRPDDTLRLLASAREMTHGEWRARFSNMVVGEMDSIALRIVHVANGAFDVAISFRKKSEWDVAAADLILREAGGQCSTCADATIFSYNRPEPIYESLLATGTGLQEKMLELLK